ncbi:MAG: hypothetical protein ACXIUQ_06830 [Cecembia sp.]
MRDKLWFLFFFNRNGRKGKFNDFFSAMNARERGAMWVMQLFLAAFAIFFFLAKPWRSLRFFPKAKRCYVFYFGYPTCGTSCGFYFFLTAMGARENSMIFFPQ